MRSDIKLLVELAISFLPFVLFTFLNSKVNVKKDNRYRQYILPIFTVLYSAVMLIFLNQLSQLCLDCFLEIANIFDELNLAFIGEFLRNIYTSWGIYLSLVLFNTAALMVYIILKRVITLIVGKIHVSPNSFISSVVEIFYSHDDLDKQWYIKEHFGDARSYLKAIYYGSCFCSGLTLFISCGLCMNNLISAPFYPVFAVIIIGEMAFYIDGKSSDEKNNIIEMQTDKSNHIAMYPLLRKPLKTLFGDKLSAEGTTVNNGGEKTGSIEEILIELENKGGHIGQNYAMFIRKKMDNGLKPNVDYVRCGYDLASGKSLLFNTPFYDKLNPYVFYAMNRELLTGGKVLVVLGRHGTENDLYQWCENGMMQISNIPNLWKIATLTNTKVSEDDLPDIGIISRSGVHDLDIHKNNMFFLKKVSFVIVIEPSRLVTTAQIGLNLLVKCCGKEKCITFCSVDRNCDGLVDALSHILMTNITEVSATEYPHGISSFMYWTADQDYLQHRILPGVSRYLGMGTELSAVALKNQVKTTVWYGGDTFPVQDVRWIAKQYYHDLLEYAQLPTNQETFDKCFQTSFNMCNEKVNDYSYITVEDDRNNLFETRRNFATIAEQQGFVNVISSEYMLREYMAENTELFTADAKAIPFVTADYARTKRNSILSISLRLCIDSVQEEVLRRNLVLIHLDTTDPSTAIWDELCVIFNDKANVGKDKNGLCVLSVVRDDGRIVSFEKDSTILFKREYSIETGKFESVYTIENSDFARLILDDLQNATYIAEHEGEDIYLGTELKGHVYQKYLPGQFFTLNGKYYEMISTTSENRILVRRASEHIGGRMAYRQVRNYSIQHLEDSNSMGELKTVNDIAIHYQYADFSVNTPGYWKLGAYNDFDNGAMITVNGIPTREYYHKQVLKLDFSKFGEAFTDSIRFTLTNLLNEVFVTMFAENAPFISAITPGVYEAPLTYSLSMDLANEESQKCIFIIEDSQLDIGLLVAVERNANRIFQIISDYLGWNDERIEESMRLDGTASKLVPPEKFDVFAEHGTPKKYCIFDRIKLWFKRILKKDSKEGPDQASGSYSEPEDHESVMTESSEDEQALEIDKNLTPKQKKKAEKLAAKAERKAQKDANRLAKKLKRSKKDSALESDDQAKADTASEEQGDDLTTDSNSENTEEVKIGE